MCDRIEHSKVAWGHIGAKLFVVLQHIVHHRALSPTMLIKISTLLFRLYGYIEDIIGPNIIKYRHFFALSLSLFFALPSSFIFFIFLYFSCPSRSQLNAVS